MSPTMIKPVLRKFVPNFLLQQRSIVVRLGAQAGWIYAKLRLLDSLGFRGVNRRVVPAGARSFLFVCFGNIMRSAMAEFLMRKMALENAPERANSCRARGSSLGTRSRCRPWSLACRPSVQAAHSRNGRTGRLYFRHGFSE